MYIICTIINGTFKCTYMMCTIIKGKIKCMNTIIKPAIIKGAIKCMNTMPAIMKNAIKWIPQFLWHSNVSHNSCDSQMNPTIPLTVKCIPQCLWQSIVSYNACILTCQPGVYWFSSSLRPKFKTVKHWPLLPCCTRLIWVPGNRSWKSEGGCHDIATSHTENQLVYRNGKVPLIVVSAGQTWASSRGLWRTRCQLLIPTTCAII